MESLTAKFLELEVADVEPYQTDDIDKTLVEIVSISVFVHHDNAVPDQVEEMDIHVNDPPIFIENL